MTVLARRLAAGVLAAALTALWAVLLVRIDPYVIAVGTPITERPPHRSVRAELPHTAPTSGV